MAEVSGRCLKVASSEIRVQKSAPLKTFNLQLATEFFFPRIDLDANAR